MKGLRLFAIFCICVHVCIGGAFAATSRGIVRRANSPQKTIRARSAVPTTVSRVATVPTKGGVALKCPDGTDWELKTTNILSLYNSAGDVMATYYPKSAFYACWTVAQDATKFNTCISKQVFRSTDVCRAPDGALTCIDPTKIYSKFGNLCYDPRDSGGAAATIVKLNTAIQNELSSVPADYLAPLKYRVIQLQAVAENGAVATELIADANKMLGLYKEYVPYINFMCADSVSGADCFLMDNLAYTNMKNPNMTTQELAELVEYLKKDFADDGVVSTVLKVSADIKKELSAIPNEYLAPLTSRVNKLRKMVGTGADTSELISDTNEIYELYKEYLLLIRLSCDFSLLGPDYNRCNDDSCLLNEDTYKNMKNPDITVSELKDLFEKFDTKLKARIAGSADAWGGLELKTANAMKRGYTFVFNNAKLYETQYISLSEISKKYDTENALNKLVELFEKSDTPHIDYADEMVAALNSIAGFITEGWGFVINDPNWTVMCEGSSLYRDIKIVSEIPNWHIPSYFLIVRESLIFWHSELNSVQNMYNKQ